MRGRISGLALFFFAIALLGWLLYDATSVQVGLGLDHVVSEGVVATAGLLIVVASLGGGAICWRRVRLGH